MTRGTWQSTSFVYDHGCSCELQPRHLDRRLKAKGTPRMMQLSRHSSPGKEAVACLALAAYVAFLVRHDIRYVMHLP